MNGLLLENCWISKLAVTRFVPFQYSKINVKVLNLRGLILLVLDVALGQNGVSSLECTVSFLKENPGRTRTRFSFSTFLGYVIFLVGDYLSIF